MSLLYELTSSAAVAAAGLLSRERDGSAAVIVYGRKSRQNVVFRCPPRITAGPRRADAVIVYFGSGGDCPDAARRFGEMGYSSAVCGYRPFGGRLPALADDAFSALSAALGYMREAGLGRRVILAGSSVGALAAALCALDADTREARGVDCEIAGLLSVGGPLDLKYAVKRMSWLKMAALSAFSGMDADEIYRYSPAEHIGETPLKVLCVHGKYDNIVPYAGAMRFVRKINAEAKLSGAGRRAAMLEIVDPKYQHFRLCAGLWRESSSASPILRHVSGWLESV